MEENGSADLTFVSDVAKSIGKLMSRHLTVVDKSTVPVGTAEKVKSIIQSELDNRKSNLTFDVVSNPEFLKEGAAINDFMRPDRVVIGAENERAMNLMKQLYSPFTFNYERFIGMDIRSAEMTKYAANAMLATKISFINEMANICEILGADVNQVRLGIGSDKRIGYHFIYPGCGYGGSCFPKDVNALIHLSEQVGYNPRLLNAVEKVNHFQKKVLINKLTNRMGQDLNGKKFAVWGLAFKPGTDDMRQAPSLDLIKHICLNGGQVFAYDPKAIDEAKNYLKDFESSITYFDNKYQVLNDVDALFLVTEWKEFRSPDFNKMKSLMSNHLIFDGRNQYNYEVMNKFGFQYEQIGVTKK